MTRQQWERLKEVFGNALEQPPAEREPFVRKAAQDDPELVAELVRLLEGTARDSGVLSRPALARARPLSETVTPAWENDATQDAPRFSPGTVLARRFRVLRFLARGGMGEVYEAEDLDLGESVALKMMRRRVAPDSQLLALFKREVQLARRVTHPCVCRIFDLAQHEDPEAGTTTLLSMQLLDGRTLEEHLRAAGPFKFLDALPLIEEVAAGLQAIHDAGVIHGDLKPGNIMLTTSPGETRLHAVVTDFGLALPASQEEPTPVPLFGGTPEYLSPEQAKGGPATAASDVYALALLIGELLGVPRAPRLEPDAARMPSRWVRALQRCLDADPGHRYARPADLATHLRVTAGRPSRMAVRITASSALALLGILSGLFLARRPATRTPDGAGAVARQIWRNDLADTRDSVSPDGRYLTFTEGGDLAIRDLETGENRRLTDYRNRVPAERGAVLWPVFSPHSDQIAYAWYSDAHYQEVRIINTKNKGGRTLLKVSGAQVEDWSADGAYLLVDATEVRGEGPLMLISVSDGRIRTLPVAKGWADGKARFSPDGRYVAYETRPGADGESADGKNDIYLLSVDGSRGGPIVQHPANDELIGWSPDGASVIFVSDRSGTQDIFAQALQAGVPRGEPELLKRNVDMTAALSLTRKGTLFYQTAIDVTDVFTAEIDSVSSVGSQPRLLSRHFEGSKDYPAWSPDGDSIAYVPTRGTERPALIVASTKNSSEREIFPELSEIAQLLAWSPDSHSVFVRGRGSQGFGIYQVLLNTGSARMVASGFPDEPAFSPDGKTIYYGVGRESLYSRNLDSGQTKELYRHATPASLKNPQISVSADGSELAFLMRDVPKGRDSLAIMSATGAHPRVLMTIKPPEVFHARTVAWTRDARYVVVVRSHNNNCELWSVRLSDGRTERTPLQTTGDIRWLRMSPDGRRFAFVRSAGGTEIWALDNFLTAAGRR